MDERTKIAKRETKILRVVQMASFLSSLYKKRCSSRGFEPGAGCSWVATGVYVMDGIWIVRILLRGGSMEYVDAER